jgi:hypothetical protein
MEKIIIMPQYQSRRIKGKGFTYDFNLHEDDIVKSQPLSNCTHLPI